MPPKVLCHICKENVPLSDILVYTVCGHGFCNGCVDRSFRRDRRIECALCRASVVRSEAKPVYLDLVDSARSDAEITIEGLNKMNADTKLISVQRGEKRIKKAVESLNCDNDIANSLQRAMDDFRSRIIPNFSKIEKQAKEIAALRESLLCAQQDVKSLQDVEEDSLRKDGELAALRAEVREAQKESEQAVSLAESMQDEVLRLRQSSDSAQQEKDKLEEDNHRLRTMLDRQSKNAHAQSNKIKGLKQEVASLKARNDELENSQIVQESLVVDDHHEFSFHSSPSSTRLSSAEPYEHAALRLSDRSSSASFSAHGYNEGMPGPGFSSDWKMNLSPDRQKNLKRKASALKSTTNFPIAIDRNGRPRLQVQTGPIRSRRAP